ncbi:ATP-binding protein [Erysipelotrichaceae bacterium OttesenSCG-928-M19]|nr:ATP-binding protein [Erysipelotrichaceae bacterium OttesenSCG-928-M19]
MKRVSFNVNSDAEAAKKRILAKYRDDTFFVEEYKKIVDRVENVLDIIDSIESKRLCLDCDGLAECKQLIRGQYLEIIDSEMKYCGCPYFIKKQEVNNKLKNLVYSSDAINYDLADKKDFLALPSRAKIYQHFDLLMSNKTNKGFYLFGPAGVGKTFIIDALLNEYLSKEIKCAYLLLNDFGTQMNFLYYSMELEDKEMFYRLIKRLKNVPVLIIDDIGSEKNSAFLRDEVLFPILDYRMKNKKTTHFTSNYPLTTLEEHYSNTSAKLLEPVNGRRIIERIKVLSEPFELDDKSLR